MSATRENLEETEEIFKEEAIIIEAIFLQEEKVLLEDILEKEQADLTQEIQGIETADFIKLFKLEKYILL